MYALNLMESEFWLGELNTEGQITGFTNFILGQPLPRLLKGDNMFYYVQVQDDNGELDVHVVQWYMALSKTDPLKHHSIASMVESGIVDPIESGNKILQLHRKPKH
jgi:hypothetical protein